MYPVTYAQVRQLLFDRIYPDWQVVAPVEVQVILLAKAVVH